jgi:predicted anti-sigma-YlaC factor YlaD
MSLSQQQVRTLVQLAVTTTPDDMDCDGCQGRIAEFAEVHLANLPLSETMRRVENHLNNCPCCKDEFEALKAALAVMFEGS